MTQTIAETSLREEAARAVALDVFTVIADSQADVAENARVATLTQDSVDSTVWWADLVEDIPDHPPTVAQRGRWKLQLGTPGYVSTPETIGTGRPTCSPQDQPRTAGVYQLLDNRLDAGNTDIDFEFNVNEAATYWTELDHSVRTAAGTTVDANHRLGSGAGSDSAALVAMGWPTRVTADANSNRPVQQSGTVKVPGGRRFAAVGIRTALHTITPMTLGVIADWGAITLTPPAGSRRFVGGTALSFTSVADLARTFTGHDANTNGLAGWIPGGWEARESLNRLSDPHGRMIGVGARRIAIAERDPSYDVIDVTALSDAEIAHRYGTAGQPLGIEFSEKPNLGYQPGSGIVRDEYDNFPTGYSNTSSEGVTEAYLLYQVELAVAKALAEIFLDMYLLPDPGAYHIHRTDFEPAQHRYLFQFSQQVGDGWVTQEPWFKVIFSQQSYQPGTGRIDRSNCTAVDDSTTDTDDAQTTLEGPINYQRSQTVTEDDTTTLTFTEEISFENGVTVNAGDGLVSASDTLTSRFGFTAQQVSNKETSKSVTIQVTVDVPDGQTWTLIYTVQRGGQSCDVSINAVSDWAVRIEAGQGFNCSVEPYTTAAEYICPGSIDNNGVFEFDSVADILTWLNGYDLRNLQIKNYQFGEMAQNAIKWLSQPDNRRIHFKGNERSLSDAHASYRITKAATPP